MKSKMINDVSGVPHFMEYLTKSNSSSLYLGCTCRGREEDFWNNFNDHSKTQIIKEKYVRKIKRD